MPNCTTEFIIIEAFGCITVAKSIPKALKVTYLFKGLLLEGSLFVF